MAKHFRQYLAWSFHNSIDWNSGQKIRYSNFSKCQKNNYTKQIVSGGDSAKKNNLYQHNHKKTKECFLTSENIVISMGPSEFYFLILFY